MSVSPHAVSAIICKMRTKKTLEDLRHYWCENIGNNYKLQIEVQTEKDKLKGLLPSRRELEAEISTIRALSTRKDMQRHFIQMKPQMKRLRSVRQAFEDRLQVLAK